MTGKSAGAEALKSGRILLLSVLVAAGTGAAAGALVSLLVGRGPVPVGPAIAPTITSPGTEPASRPEALGDDLEDLRRTVGRLSEEVARLASQGERRQPVAAVEPVEDQATRIRSLIDRIKHLEHGERHLEIEKALRELVELGEAVVPDLIALLQSGFDIDYGGGMSTTGAGRFQSYPRLRTMLLDALRQIGTPHAKQALLDAVRSGTGLADYRDLFILYRTTSDEQVVQGMALLLPELLERMKKGGHRRADETILLDQLCPWIRQHQQQGSVPFLMSLLEVGQAVESYQKAAIIGVLIELSPEQAATVVKGLMDRAADQGSVEHSLGMLVRMTGSGSLTLLARFYRALFAQINISPAEERNLWRFTSHSLDRTIQDQTKRVADAKPLLDFLEERLQIARGEEIRALLERQIQSLRQRIDRLQRE